MMVTTKNKKQLTQVFNSFNIIKQPIVYKKIILCYITTMERITSLKTTEVLKRTKKRCSCAFFAISSALILACTPNQDPTPIPVIQSEGIKDNKDNLGTPKAFRPAIISEDLGANPAKILLEGGRLNVFFNKFPDRSSGHLTSCLKPKLLEDNPEVEISRLIGRFPVGINIKNTPDNEGGLYLIFRAAIPRESQSGVFRPMLNEDDICFGMVFNNSEITQLSVQNESLRIKKT